MRVLLSTIGSRGEVQPLVALALALREQGAEVRVCAPPDFDQLAGGLGLPFVPIGPRVHSAATSGVVPSAEERLKLIEGTVATQFETIGAAAQDCDLIVGCGALQVAAPSIAEARRIPYAFAVYCPLTLPSVHHPPLPIGQPMPEGADNAALWALEGQRWDATWRELLDRRRASLGLAPVAHVRDHVLTRRPLLAADAVLAPWVPVPELDVWQTGAWVVPGKGHLPVELERFLDAGDPPVYVGFGSMRATADDAGVAVATARELGRRAVVSRGWAGVEVEAAADVLAIDDVDHRALFPRVAAVLHHGGAGTTTTAALAGAPQVIAPRMYDQPYFAGRVRDLGVGTAHPRGALKREALAAALSEALRPEVAGRAASLAGAMRTDGASATARLLLAEHAG